MRGRLNKKRSLLLLGIASVFALGISAAIISIDNEGNQVENASFEAHGYIPYNSYQNFTSIPGWSSPDNIIQLHDGHHGGIFANSGDTKLELDALGNTTVEQALSTTYKQRYDLNLYYTPRITNNGTDTNDVEVWWEDEILATLSGDKRGWQHHQYDVQALGDITTLRLVGAGASDNYGGFIDDVRVSLVPYTSGNLVENASFEEHGALNNGGYITNLPSWDIEQGDIRIRRYNQGGFIAKEGIVKLKLESSTDTILSQDIATNDDIRYELSFNYSSKNSNTEQNQSRLEVWWDDTLLDTVTGDRKAWQRHRYDVTRSSDTTTLTFKANDGKDSFVDDVRVYGTCRKSDNLIENGSFENHPPLQYDYLGRFNQIEGWVAEDGVVEIHINGLDGNGVEANEGIALLDTDANANATVTQTVTTEAGETYTLQFDYSPRVEHPGTNTNNVEVWWDGQILTTLSGDLQGWQHNRYTVEATTNQTALTFKGVGSSNAFGGLIDDVALYIANTQPSIDSTPVTTATVNTPYTDTVIASDADGDDITYSINTFPDGMEIDASSGVITWTPETEGTEDVTVQATDTCGEMSTQSYSITVTEGSTNSQPNIVSTPITEATVGIVYSYDVEATDTDNDTLDYSLQIAPTGMTIDNVTGVISWTPTSTQVGSNTVIVTVDDSNGGTASQTFDATVVQSSSPVLNIPINDQVVNEDTLFNFVIPAATFTDPDVGDVLSFNASLADDSALPTWLSFGPSTQTFTGTPANENVGQLSVKVSVTDLSGMSVSDTFTLTIVNINDAPVIVNNNLTITEGGFVVLTTNNLSATDVDNPDESLVFTVSNVVNGQFELVDLIATNQIDSSSNIVSNVMQNILSFLGNAMDAVMSQLGMLANAMTLDPVDAITTFTQQQIINGEIQFIHDGSEAPPSFDVSVSDGSLSDTSTVSGNDVTFSALNDAPIISTNNGLTLDEAATATIGTAQLEATDPDDIAADLTYTVTSGPNSGQLEFSDNTGVAITSFTQEDINTNRLNYVHDGSEPAPSSEAFPAELELSTLLSANGGDGSDGFIVNGVHSVASISSIGDINNDGFDDVIIGVVSSANKTFVVYGGANGFPSEYDLNNLLQENGGDGSIGFVVNDINQENNNFGTAVSSAGDVNADGINDLVISASRSSLNGSFRAGASYILYGRNGGFGAEVNLSDLLPTNGGDGSEGFAVYGVNDGERIGSSLSNVGDINADGIDDIIFGTINSLKSYLVFGQSTGFSAELNLSTLLSANGGDGSTGFVIEGFDDSGTGSSLKSVSSAGDINGDGVNDLLIGLSSAAPNGLSGAGQAFVVFGRSTGFPAEFSLSTLLSSNGGDGSSGFALNGAVASEAAGRAVSSAGDVNGDGADDILIGGTSIVYLIYGSTNAFSPEFELSTLFSVNAGTAGTTLDSADFASLSSAGDVNNDGFDDILLGTVLRDDLPAGVFAVGQSYLFYGKAGTLGADLDVEDLLIENGGDGSDGVVIKGLAITQEVEGHPDFVSSAGDVNGDGVDDIIIGHTEFDGGNSGSDAAYIVFAQGGNASLSDSFDVSVIDGGEDGVSPATDTFNIFVTPVNDPPVLVNNSLTVNEGQTVVLTTADLSVVDPDNLDNSLLFTVSNVVNGQFEFVNNHGVAITSFTQQQVNNGLVQFVHNGSPVPPSYDVSVSDGNLSDTGSGNTAVTFNLINDAPEVITNNVLTLSEGGTATIITTDLETIDEDDVAADLNYTVTNGPSSGQLEFSDNAGVAITSFTQEDIDTNRLNYVHDGSEPFDASSAFQAEFNLVDLLVANGGDGGDGFVLNGIDSIDLSGRAVSSAGDVNGDGIEDIIVSAIFAGSNETNVVGETYVVFGQAGGFSAEFNLADLLSINGGDGSAGFILKGINFADGSGNSVSTAGDVNNDGFDDLIIGASRANNFAGQSYVVFGRSSGFSAEFELSSLQFESGGDGSQGFILNGVNANDDSGVSVSTAGDINNDGIDDLLIGASRANNLAGQSYVVFGRSSDFSAEFNLNTLLSVNGGDGSQGFILNGATSNDRSGISVSSVGDINGDGIDDLVIGSRSFIPSKGDGVGASYVLYGKSGDFAAEINLSQLFSGGGEGEGSEEEANNEGFVIIGVGSASLSSEYVSSAGDVNGDGINDIIIGENLAAANGNSRSGESYVVFGQSSNFTGDFELFNLSATNGGDGSSGFVINGVNVNDRSGISVSSAGDINNDGFDDVIIATNVTENTAPDTREAYVVFGKASGFSAELNLSDLLLANGGDGSIGFALDLANDQIELDRPTVVSGVGDVNGDGVDDLIVGASNNDTDDNAFAGRSYILFGRGNGFSDSFDFSVIDGGEDGASPAIDTFEINVNPIDDTAPIVGDDSVTLDQGANALINLVANDSDSESGLDLSSLVIGSASSGSIVDNGDGTVTYTHNGDDGNTSDTFTYTINDLSGNTSASATVSISVNDISPPVVTAPADITVEATGVTTAVTLGSATATDLVDGTLTPTADNLGPFAVGVHTVTWSATDAAGNVGSATQTVTITDTTGPVVTAPADITVEASGATTAVTLGSATATDLVDSTLTPMADNLGPFAVGVHTVTWSATDAAGNVGTATQTVTITDTTAPAVTPPADITVEASGATTAVILGSATATDLVDGILTPTADNLGPFAVGVNTITWSATDAAGNVGSTTQTVTITDTTAPAVTPAADITVEASGATTAVTLGLATASDLVDGTLTPTADNLGPFAVGVHTVTWSATDVAGNEGTATQTVTITDTTGPVVSINSPADGLVTNQSAQTIIGNLSDVSGVSALLINGQAVTLTANNFNHPISLNDGVNTIVLHATDVLNNTSTSTLTITLDSNGPEINIISPVNGLLTNQNSITIQGSINESGSLQVNNQTVTLSGNDFTLNETLASGLNTFTFEATDAVGNVSSRVLLVTLDLTSGNQGDFINNFIVENNISSSPAIDDNGNIYIGTADGYLHSFDKDGINRWSFYSGDHISATPAISNDNQSVYFGNHRGMVFSLASDDGNKQWEFFANGVVYTSPGILSNGFIVIGTTDNQVYALNNNGVIQWSFTSNGEVGGSPAVDYDDTIYLGDSAGYLYALNPKINASTRLKWQIQLSITNGVSSPSITDDGLVIAGTFDGTVFGVNANQNASQRIAWTSAQLGDAIASSATLDENDTIFVGNLGTTAGVHALSTNTGALLWTFPTSDEIYATPIIGSDGVVHVGTLGSEIIGLDPALFNEQIPNPNDLLTYTTTAQSPIVASAAISSTGELITPTTNGVITNTNAGVTIMADSYWPTFSQNNLRTSRNNQDAELLQVVTHDQWPQLQAFVNIQVFAKNAADDLLEIELLRIKELDVSSLLLNSWKFVNDLPNIESFTVSATAVVFPEILLSANKLTTFTRGSTVYDLTDTTDIDNNGKADVWDSINAIDTDLDGTPDMQDLDPLNPNI